MGNSLSLSGVCDDRGQHAADAVAAAREPGMEKIHVVGKIFWPRYFAMLRFCPRPIDRGLRPLCSREPSQATLRAPAPPEGELQVHICQLGEWPAAEGSPAPLVREGLVALLCCAAAEGNSFSLRQLPREGAGYGEDPWNWESFSAARKPCFCALCFASRRPRRGRSVPASGDCVGRSLSGDASRASSPGGGALSA